MKKLYFITDRDWAEVEVLKEATPVDKHELVLDLFNYNRMVYIMLSALCTNGWPSLNWYHTIPYSIEIVVFV